jgi:hypothetical protein
MKTSKNKLLAVLATVASLFVASTAMAGEKKGNGGSSSGSRPSAPPTTSLNPNGAAERFGVGNTKALGDFNAPPTTSLNPNGAAQRFGIGNTKALGDFNGSQNTSNNPNGNGTNTTTIFGGTIHQGHPPMGNYYPYYPGTPYVAGRPIYENPAFSGLPIKITNPAASGVTLNYTLQGTLYTIAPGYSQDLAHDRSWVVEFNRGANLGQARYGLEPGTYAFTHTEHGWELYRVPDVQSAPIEAPSNPPPPVALPANPAPKP